MVAGVFFLVVRIKGCRKTSVYVVYGGIIRNERQLVKGLANQDFLRVISV